MVQPSKAGESLSVFDASSALLSTIIGGGIVGVPYGMYLSGIPMGLIMNVICWILCYVSVMLYMEAKSLSGVSTKTLYEFGYVSMGKGSIFFIAFLSTVQTVGFVMIYFIVFGDIAGSIVSQLFLRGGMNFWSSRIFWDIILSAVLFPVILKKTLTEMKLAADLHFVAVALFLICMLIQRFTKEREYNPDPVYNYWSFHWKLEEITTFSILLCSYNFSFIEFPLYHSLGPGRTPDKLLSATSLALTFTIVIYVTTGLLGIYLFGSAINSNCLVNISDEGNNFFSMAVRIAFAFVVACHVPYVFFYGKEGCCIVWDEIANKSTSGQLAKLENEAGEVDEEEPPAYFNMNQTVYYGITIFLFALTILGANLVPNCAIIFDYMAALSISGMQFFLPGLAYIRL